MTIKDKNQWIIANNKLIKIEGPPSIAIMDYHGLYNPGLGQIDNGLKIAIHMITNGNYHAAISNATGSGEFQKITRNRYHSIGRYCQSYSQLPLFQIRDCKGYEYIQGGNQKQCGTTIRIEDSITDYAPARLKSFRRGLRGLGRN